MEDKKFTVIEYFSGFAIRHNATGREHWLSDGVDSLFDSDGNALSPGSEGFVDRWTEAMNYDPFGEVLEVYFPDLADAEEE